MQDTSLLLVCLVDVVESGTRSHTKEGIESRIAALVLGDFVLKAEDFMVCQLSVSNCINVRLGRNFTFGTPGCDQSDQAQE